MTEKRIVEKLAVSLCSLEKERTRGEQSRLAPDRRLPSTQTYFCPNCGQDVAELPHGVEVPCHWCKLIITSSGNSVQVSNMADTSNEDDT